MIFVPVHRLEKASSCCRVRARYCLRNLKKLNKIKILIAVFPNFETRIFVPTKAMFAKTLPLQLQQLNAVLQRLNQYWGGTAQLVERRNDKPGAVLARVGFLGAEKGYFSKSQFSSAGYLKLSVQPSWAMAPSNICAHVKNPKHWQPYHCSDTHTASIPLFGHTEQPYRCSDTQSSHTAVRTHTQQPYRCSDTHTAAIPLFGHTHSKHTAFRIHTAAVPLFGHTHSSHTALRTHTQQPYRCSDTHTANIPLFGHTEQPYHCSDTHTATIPLFGYTQQPYCCSDTHSSRTAVRTHTQQPYRCSDTHRNAAFTGRNG